MKQAAYPVRTQISLSPQLKQLIEQRGALLDESLSAYLRRAAVLRMALEDVEAANLKRVARAVVSSVPRSSGGWRGVKDIRVWQRQARKDEDRHRA